jgi:hypothetical protein
MKPVEKVLGRLEGVVESEGVVRFRIAREKSEESEVSVLTRIYALAIQKYQEYEKAAEPAPEPDSCNDAAIVTNTEEVSHVEQRLDRPSEIVVTHSRKGSKAWSIFEACLGRNIGRAPTA